MPSSNDSSGDKQKYQHSIANITVTDLTTIKKREPGAGMKQLRPGTSVTKDGQHIVELQTDFQQLIEEFSAGAIKDNRGVRYSDVIGDTALAKKSSRFRINELTRGPLSVEAEEEARIQAEVQARLDQKIEEIRVQVTEKAHQDGLAQGREQGRQEVLTQSKPLLEQFTAMIQSFESMSSEVFKSNEEFLIRMVYQIAKAVILRDVKEDSDYVRRLVAHLIERVGTRENIKVFVGEAEFSSAEALKEGLAQSLGELKNISVELDREISSKGCRVETEFGEVDARIEVQIQNIAQALGATGS